MSVGIQPAVLVSGATGLLGSAIVDLLLANGCTILALDLNSAALVDLVEKYGQDRCAALVVDLSSELGFTKLKHYLEDSNIRLTAAVHSAYPRSLGWGARLEDLEPQNLYFDLNAQLGGAILFSKILLEYFKKMGGGSLIHISSIQGVHAPKFEHYVGTSMHSPVEYSAIKAGIVSITRWLAKYYSNTGIRVNCVSPGGIYDHQPDSFLRKYKDDCTNVGMLDPVHVASLVLYLLSPNAVAVNGQNLIVDDGWSL